MLFCITSLSLVLSCDKLIDDEKPTSGKWYLISYNDATCDWGEYIQFRNGKLDWNNRLGGKNSTYDCSISGTTFSLTNCSDSDREDVVFTITGYSDKEMVTYSSDDITRCWKR